VFLFISHNEEHTPRKLQATAIPEDCNEWNFIPFGTATIEVFLDGTGIDGLTASAIFASRVGWRSSGCSYDYDAISKLHFYVLHY